MQTKNPPNGKDFLPLSSRSNPAQCAGSRHRLGRDPAVAGLRRDKDAGRLMRVPAHTGMNLVRDFCLALHSDLERGDDDLLGALAFVAVIGGDDEFCRRALEVNALDRTVLAEFRLPPAHIAVRAVDGHVAQFRIHGLASLSVSVARVYGFRFFRFWLLALPHLDQARDERHQHLLSLLGERLHQALSATEAELVALGGTGAPQANPYPPHLTLVTAIPFVGDPRPAIDAGEALNEAQTKRSFLHLFLTERWTTSEPDHVRNPP